MNVFKMMKLKVMTRKNYRLKSSLTKKLPKMIAKL